MTTTWRTAIVGGGPAGLQAALTLARMHVPTVLFDDGVHRNDVSPRMHNVLGSDGATPAEHRAAALRDLAPYDGVTVVHRRIESVERDGSSFVLTAGAERWRSERLLLAAGVHDELLPVPGLRELWGRLVLPCPYCHGHEHRVGPIAVISTGAHADHVAALLRQLGPEVPVSDPADVVRVAPSGDGVLIELRDGRTVTASCVFIPPNPVPRTSIVASLGIGTAPDGVLVDALGRTDVPGVWAAGDVAARPDPRMPAAVVTAMSQGLVAAADIAADVAG